MTRFGFGKKKLIIMVVAVLVVAFVIYLAVRSGSGGKYQLVSVARGSITQVVSVTGNTTPIRSVDLSFPAGGTIAAVYKNAGDHVNAGDVLAALDTRSLQAQLAQAEAQVDSAQATLENLQAGSTPQNVQVSQAAVTAAEQTLANTYTSIPNAVSDAYAKANDAVRNQISAFYNNPDTSNPQLSFTVSDSQVVNDAASERVQVGGELTTWATESQALASSSVAAALPTSTLATALTRASAHLSVISTMLNTDAQAVVDATSLTPSSSAAYKTDIADAVSEIHTAATAITTLQQDIASEEAAVAQAEAQLNVTLAGSTPQAIAAQQAQVEQAQASAENIKVQIANATLSSPITGVITAQNAKTGQVAVAGQTITSIISDNNFEVDTYIPETDIGKVAAGDDVDMTFDAFPGETFSGKIFYVDPAETVQSGVVDYLVKISFTAPDSRIKSGLTANLNIKTKTDDNALILPQYAIIQNASGTYVDILQNGKETQVPVTLGIRDENGNVEVVSGISEGQQVVNIGLKTQ